MTVKLVEAAPVAGALRFELMSEGRYEKVAQARSAPRQTVRAAGIDIEAQAKKKL